MAPGGVAWKEGMGGEDKGIRGGGRNEPRPREDFGWTDSGGGRVDEDEELLEGPTGYFGGLPTFHSERWAVLSCDMGWAGIGVEKILNVYKLFLSTFVLIEIKVR